MSKINMSKQNSLEEETTKDNIQEFVTSKKDSCNQKKKIFAGILLVTLVIIISVVASLGGAEEEVILSQDERLIVAQASLKSTTEALGLNVDTPYSEIEGDVEGSDMEWSLSDLENAGLDVSGELGFLQLGQQLGLTNLVYLGNNTDSLPEIFDKGGMFAEPGWMLNQYKEPVPFQAFQAGMDIAGVDVALTLILGVGDLSEPESVDMAWVFAASNDILVFLESIGEQFGSDVSWLSTLSVVEGGDSALAVSTGSFYFDNNVYIGEGVTTPLEMTGSDAFDGWGFFDDMNASDCEDWGIGVMELWMYLPISQSGEQNWDEGHFNLKLPAFCFSMTFGDVNAMLQGDSLALYIQSPQANYASGFSFAGSIGLGDALAFGIGFFAEYGLGHFESDFYVTNSVTDALLDFLEMDLVDAAGNYNARGSLGVDIGTDKWELDHLFFESGIQAMINEFKYASSLRVSLAPSKKFSMVTSIALEVPTSLGDLLCDYVEFCDDVEWLEDMNIGKNLAVQSELCSNTMIYDHETMEMCLFGFAFYYSSDIVLPEQFQEVFDFLGMKQEGVDIGIYTPVLFDLGENLLTNLKYLIFDMGAPKLFIQTSPNKLFAAEGEELGVATGRVAVRKVRLALGAQLSTSAVVDVKLDNGQALVFFTEGSVSLLANFKWNGQMVNKYENAFGIQGFEISRGQLQITFNPILGVITQYFIAGDFDMGQTQVEFAMYFNPASWNGFGLIAKVEDLSAGDMIDFMGFVADRDFSQIAKAFDNEGLFHIEDMTIMIATNWFKVGGWNFDAGFLVNGTMSMLGVDLLVETALIFDPSTMRPDFIVTILMSEFGILSPLSTILRLLSDLADLVEEAAKICVPGFDDICYHVNTDAISAELDSVADWLEGLVYFNEIGIDDFSMNDLLLGEDVEDAGELVFDLELLGHRLEGRVGITAGLLKSDGIDNFFDEQIEPFFEDVKDAIVEHWCEAFSKDLCVEVGDWSCCVEVSGCPSITCPAPTDNLLDAIGDWFNGITGTIGDGFCGLIGC